MLISLILRTLALPFLHLLCSIESGGLDLGGSHRGGGIKADEWGLQDTNMGFGGSEEEIGS